MVPGVRRGVPATDGVPGTPAMDLMPVCPPEGVIPARALGVALTDCPALGSKLSPKSPFSICTPLSPPKSGVWPCCSRAKFCASATKRSSPRAAAALGVRIGVANLYTSMGGVGNTGAARNVQVLLLKKSICSQAVRWHAALCMTLLQISHAHASW